MTTLKLKLNGLSFTYHSYEEWVQAVKNRVSNPRSLTEGFLQDCWEEGLSPIAVAETWEGMSSLQRQFWQIVDAA